MKQFSKIITGLFICLTVGACSSESDSKKAIDNVNRSIAQTKRDIDKIAEDAKKQADKARGNNLDLTYTYDTVKMRQVIGGVYGISEIPEFTGVAKTEDIEVLPDKPDIDLKSLFKNIQKNIFGKDNLIDLKFCKDCGFHADYFSKTIFITPSEVQLILVGSYLANPVDVLTYVLTHELSHFVHEISAHAPYSNKEFTTINGLPSAYISDINMLMNLRVEDAMRSHAEVDVYASLILKSQGFKSWNDIDAFFVHEINREKAYGIDSESSKWVVADFSNRRRVVKEVSLVR